MKRQVTPSEVVSAIDKARVEFANYENKADFLDYKNNMREWRIYKHLRHVARKLARKAGYMHGVAKDLP